MEKKTIEENMTLYNAVRAVPEEAKKPFDTGRFKGTDVNPMWRLKVLTEQFGPCGIGHYVECTRKWTEQCTDGSIAAFVDINLYVKYNGEWSKPIFGTGGSKLVTMEKKYSKSGELSISPYLSDEAYKMAYTDAISVACKALGIAADVYYEKDKSKYTIADEKRAEEEKAAATREAAPAPAATTVPSFHTVKKTLQPGKPGWKETIAWLSDLRKDPKTVKDNYIITEENFQALCKAAGRAS